MIKYLCLLVVFLTVGLLFAAFLAAINFMWFSAAVCLISGFIGLAHIDTLEGIYNEL